MGGNFQEGGHGEEVVVGARELGGRHEGQSADAALRGQVTDACPAGSKDRESERKERKEGKKGGSKERKVKKERNGRNGRSSVEALPRQTTNESPLLTKEEMRARDWYLVRIITV